MKKNHFLAVSVAFCLLMFIETFSQNSMKVHIIDVGQGSATLLEFPCGVALIDVGGELNEDFDSNDEMRLFLLEFFNRRRDLNKTIDLLVISHPHKDHTRSLIDLFDYYTIKNVITNGQEKGSGRVGQKYVHEKIKDLEINGPANKIIHYTESRNSKIDKSGWTNKYISPISCDSIGPTITLLWGRVNSNPGWSDDAYRDANNHSVVMRVDYGEASMLLTGDLEFEAIDMLLEKFKDTKLLDVDFYLVGHHGSYNGTTKEFVEKMSPEIAVLSFGSFEREYNWTAWAYGHPREAVIDILNTGVSGERLPKKVRVATGVKNFKEITMKKAVYATGWDGDLLFEATSSGQWSSEYDLSASNFSESIDFINMLSNWKAGTDEYMDLRKTNLFISNSPSDGTIPFFYDNDSLPGIGPATMTRIRAKLRGEN